MSHQFEQMIVIIGALGLWEEGAQWVPNPISRAFGIVVSLSISIMLEKVWGFFT
jgi:hypothetical protein